MSPVTLLAANWFADESDLLFNHSVRVFLFGAMKGIRQNLKFDFELLYVAALFHDLGLVDAYHTEKKRFEVDGADAAREFLKAHGIPEPKADLVWEAIALHTTPGIPQFMRPEIALTNAGVLVDVVGIGYDEYTPDNGQTPTFWSRMQKSGRPFA